MFLAFDKGSVRRYSAEGHLHIEIANISKACVSPYLGSEIPGADKLGLDPNKQYKLLRDPIELERGAKTFEGKPLLIVHKPLTAESHPTQKVIGAVGTDVRFVYPFLQAELVVWPQDAIDKIESGEQREISCGYQYTPDMTPGEFEDESYDGVMRSIVGNHVTIVETGRVGAEAIIGDSMENLNMNKPLSRKALIVQGAVMGFLMPRLAQDAKLDLTKGFAGITAKNFETKRPLLTAYIEESVKGKLAQDANTEGLKALLDAMAPVEPADEIPAAATAPNAGMPFGAKKPITGGGEEEPDEEGEDADDPMGEFKQQFEAKFPEAFAWCEQALKAAQGGENPGGGVKPPGEDEQPDNSEIADGKGGKDRRGAKDKGGKDNMIDKKAMDQAIAANSATVSKAVRDTIMREQRELREAEKAVRPYVGELAIACDSAEQVYRTTLKMLGVKDADKVHASALPAILEVLPTQAQKTRADHHSPNDGFALDGANDDYGFDGIFGDDAKRIKQA